jgi:hypothetical protein
MPLADGATFAGYTIVRMLGSGGMGEVDLIRTNAGPVRQLLCGSGRRAGLPSYRFVLAMV